MTVLASDNSHSNHERATSVDFAIQGAGPVGLILALALAKANYQVALIEKQLEPQKPFDHSSFDGRVLALTLGSKQFLDQLGLANLLASVTTSIQKVHVSQQGYLGLTQLSAEDLGVAQLGVSIQAQDLGRVLWQAVEQQSAIEVYTGVEVQWLEQTDQRVNLVLGALNEASEVSGDSLSSLRVQATCLIGADGSESPVRQLLGLPLERKDYGAMAILAKITTELPHHNGSYERFTPEGPVALLPMATHDHKAVYVCDREQAQALLALSDTEYMAAFSAKMGERLGRFTAISSRVAYPLFETYAPEIRSGRVVLMGNAAHTQHPVAAQGLNLGIRDIADFIDVMTPLRDKEQDLSAWNAALDGYCQSRQVDHQATLGMTDGLIQLFQAKSPVIGHLRGLGLMALDNLPRLKKRFARKAMGF